MSQLTYNYGGISDAQGAIDQFIRLMDAELDFVETELKPLEGEAWSGSEAQVAYFDAKAKWRAAALKIAQELLNLKNALQSGADGIQATDLKAASMFGG